MNQSFNLRLGQTLKMTPQLQQAIRMLQLSAVELQQEVQEILENNPLLEEDEDNEPQHEQEGEHDEQTVANDKESSLPDELETDSSWEDTYDIPSMLGNSSPVDNLEPQDSHSSTDSLHDHLIWQLNTIPLSERDHGISIALIDAINPDGYLETPLYELINTIQLDPPVEMEELTTQLHQIQYFDPPGVGASDLRECLLIQLHQLEKKDPAQNVAINWITNYFNLIAEQNRELLCKKLSTNNETLLKALVLIRNLNPHPGDKIESTSTEYVIPDLIVQKDGDQWSIELTPETSPKLRISPFYQSIKGKSRNGSDKEYISKNIQEARWFLKSLQNRNETLFKVASHIFQVQSEFLESGAEKMRALTLRTIADAIEMHESTISRVTTNKYAQTPQGLFELKYFFSSQLNTADGDGTSATAVRAIIRQIVDNEDSSKPISDNRITILLAEKGIKVARRTVAKYRDILSIPPSNERKRLLQQD
ncbi:MAG: RNA polymerase factor sigma-54 [Gammaproteobacteria bacterium]|uniref:RNA polymerase sigma-54 factor n=1 Tax=Candidatus Thiopontia autotrophica TaxID=2841688 RepID=A0A8J6NX01_9GAMM|nr:RNA polymerase factor sigma-54 [Candidatus Thiopontia autotrophica]MBL6969333.1 RNA polymerase factor sigma-54 [Gammaproteobacteria bacterium]